MTELNQNAVAIITSALAARTQELSEASMSQFREDTVEIVQDFEPADVVMLIMVLAMDSAALLELAASMTHGKFTAAELLRDIAITHATNREKE